MSIEQTLSIIKPDATKRNLTGKIISKLEDSGLKIIAQKRILLSKTEAEDFYKVHQNRPFFSISEFCHKLILDFHKKLLFLIYLFV